MFGSGGQKGMSGTMSSFSKDGPLSPKAPATDPFATFLTLRPPKPPEPSTTEQSLREELMRTKRQLLQVALAHETKILNSVDLSSPTEETAQRVRQMRHAQKYLRHPEKTRDALSEGSDDDHLSDGWASSSQPASVPSTSPPPSRSSKRGSTRGSVASSNADSASGTPLSKGRHSASAPNLTTSAKDEKNLEGSQGKKGKRNKKSKTATSLPPIGGETMESVKEEVKIKKRPEPLRVQPHDTEPLLSGWYSKVRSWNTVFERKGVKPGRETTVKRHTLEMPGGCLVFGNGRMPLFKGGNLQNPGFFFAFEVTALAEEQFGREDVKGLGLGFGFSRVAPSDKRCERRVYGYEIPGSVMIGYGGHVIDRDHWYKIGSWDTSNLEVGDIVGLLVTCKDADIVVYVNGKQVFRMETSLAEELRGGLGDTSVKWGLFPVIDLHGFVSAVTLLPRAQPPNLPLQARIRLKEDELDKGSRLKAKPPALKVD
eukprot:gnl/TRDRNA2_/TRDRNA2_53160_c0_seq1.p1 gnl/TRDRNA2_/TRDRNA2_53160_c0~~gnl/TRDRNA2_/TRDRNA2_53160_c0_seq1.p1  ORF type:complete len:541 (+),score=69.26 gnl/TRDRNA2_/TRDRNA2_53160_c0_seq1:172-1623(+)